MQIEAINRIGIDESALKTATSSFCNYPTASGFTPSLCVQTPLKCLKRIFYVVKSEK